MTLDPMDQIVPKGIRVRRKLKAGGYVLTALLLFVLALWGFRGLVKPVLVEGHFDIDTVQLGSVYETITSTGKVELENHYTVLSPVSTVLKVIVTPPGQIVSKGDTLLILDDSALREEYQNNELEMKVLRNKVLQMDLGRDREKMDREFELMAKKMEIETLEASLADEQSLLKIGATSASNVKEIAQSLEMAMAEYEKLDKSYALTRKERTVMKDEVLIGVRQKANELEAMRLQMEKLTVTAPIAGVVVSINIERGSMAVKDTELVRISDLNTYKLTGKVPDILSEHIAPGVEVQIMIDRETRLKGTIGNVRPLVKENNVYFDIFPEQNNHPRFRPNMTVEIRIVTAFKENALIVKDGPFYDGSKKPKVYRIDGDKATGVVVTTGIKGMDHIEITDGLKSGDRVVISDVSEIDHLDEVNIVSRE